MSQVDVNAGHGGALGGALPTQPGELPLTRRLRSLLTWPTAETEPVGQLVRTHRTIHTGADPAVLRRAYTIADNMHRGQFRKSGEPFITHPLAVAQICAELGMDTTTLVAALLHDTVEDTRYTLQALAEDFDHEVAHLVDGVTKFDKAFYGQAAEAETIRKMIIAAGKDVRVLIIKLADRLHNMRTLGVRSAASRERIARKTQEVLVPLCDRLGIQTLKRELDDVVLLHLEPDEHARIARHVHDRPGWDSYLAEVVTQAKGALRRSRVDAEVAPAPGTCTRSGRTPWPAATPPRSTCPASRSLSTARRPTATRPSARCTVSGGRCRAGSRTSSPRRRTTSTGPCTRASAGRGTARSRC
ncbi:hypothetical protein GCM10029963_66670 [Micromonospora andamanensis]